MKLKTILAVLAGLTISSMAVAEVTFDDLIGTWYAETDHDGETMKWLVKREADQSYAALFLVCDGENLSWVQKERGQWKMEGKELHTVIAAFQDMNGNSSDQLGKQMHYEKLELDNDELNYEQKDNDNVYSFKRVNDGYQISCQ
jgi:hypothetical protein